MGCSCRALHRLLKNHAGRPLLGLLFGLLLGVLSSSSAQALPYYFEFGGTMAKWTAPKNVWSSLGLPAADSASSAFGIPMTFGLQLQNRVSGFLFAVALQNRYLSGQTNIGDNFTVMPTSLMLRMEFWKFVFGAGYSPYISNSISFSRASGISSALTLEGQFLFPITPEIDFGLQGARVSFSSSAGSSSVIEYGAFFRLNFGFSDQARTERRKYKGWRYPFGSPKR